MINAGSGEVAKGLEGVVVAESQLSYVFGTEGRLIYRGFDIHDLAEHATYEEVVHLLCAGALPTQAQLADLSKMLATNRELPTEIATLMKRLSPSVTPMDVLRTVVSALALYDPDAADDSPQANLRKSTRLVARMATIMAAYHRLRQGKKPYTPRVNLSHAANILYLLTGKEPDATRVRALDVYLILLADHGLNASTFSARVTAATLSDLYSAVTSALGTLKGPLHGGANEQAMKMLLEIGEVERAEGYIKDALMAKKRIMGFGHRVYKVEDPRATELRKLAQEVCLVTGNSKLFEISQCVEIIVRQEKGLYPNVDFYSASLLYALGIPIDLFTPLFACSRVAGWTAHVLEQYADNRLIRPRVKYIGPQDQHYTSIEQRA